MSHASDLYRVEALFAMLPTTRHVPAEHLGASACLAFAKKRKLNVSGINEIDSLRSVVKDAKEETCAICLVDFQARQWVKSTHCGHNFHWQCLGELVLAKASTAECPRKAELQCPTCRTDLKPPPVPKNEDGSVHAHSQWYKDFLARTRLPTAAEPGGLPHPNECAQQ